MKFTKILFIPLVMVSLFAFANATNCTTVNTDGDYVCSPLETCTQQDGCLCDPDPQGFVMSGEQCGTACPYISGSIDAYSCNVGEYCTQTNCLCNAAGPGGIGLGARCSQAAPTVSCTHAGRTIYSGQTMTVYQYANVPYTSSCGLGINLKCTNVGGTGVLIPTPRILSFSGYVLSCMVDLPPAPPAGSCTIGSTTILSGASFVAYQASSVACGSSCVSQTRTCSNGVISGTYTNTSCTVNSCGGGGGGSSYPTCTSNNLVCVNNVRARTGSNYCQGGNLGKACTISTGGNGTGTLPVGSIVGSPFSTELNNAYLWAYSRGITTMKTIQQANMTGHLLRSHMAKMISVFAVMLADIAPDTTKKCTFTDIASQSTEMKFYIKLACQLGLMGVDMTKFSPKTEITRAQFGTILSRVIWGIKYNDSTPYYTSHLNALKAAAIMTQISNPTTTDEIRGYVMLMMKRTYEGGFLNN